MLITKNSTSLGDNISVKSKYIFWYNAFSFNSYKQNNINHLLVAWILLISGSPSIKLIPGGTYITAILGVVYFATNQKFNDLKKLIYSIGFFLMIFFVQYYLLGDLPINYWMGIIASIVAGFFVFNKLGTNFRYIYFNVIYFFSLISLFFWVLQNTTGITLDLFGISGVDNILIWSVRKDPYNESILEFRNNGPFWEPGAYAGYLSALIFMFFDDFKNLWKVRKRELIVIIIAFITTFSTTGYIIVLLFFGYKVLSKNKNGSTLLLVIPIVLSFIYILVTQVSFIGEKIIKEYDISLAASDADIFINTRMGAFLSDVHYIVKRPLFGNGVDPKVRWKDNPEVMYRVLQGENIGHGNGFSGYIVSNGIILMIFILINFFLSFRKIYSKSDSLFLVFLFLVMLQGEVFLNYPFYLCFFFLILKKIN